MLHISNLGPRSSSSDGAGQGLGSCPSGMPLNLDWTRPSSPCTQLALSYLILHPPEFLEFRAGCPGMHLVSNSLISNGQCTLERQRRNSPELGEDLASHFPTCAASSINILVWVRVPSEVSIRRLIQPTSLQLTLRSASLETSESAG